MRVTFLATEDALVARLQEAGVTGAATQYLLEATQYVRKDGTAFKLRNNYLKHAEALAGDRIRREVAESVEEEDVRDFHVRWRTRAVASLLCYLRSLDPPFKKKESRIAVCKAADQLMCFARIHAFSKEGSACLAIHAPGVLEGGLHLPKFFEYLTLDEIVKGCVLGEAVAVAKEGLRQAVGLEPVHEWLPVHAPEDSLADWAALLNRLESTR